MHKLFSKSGFLCLVALLALVCSDLAAAEKPLVFVGDQDYAPLIFLDKGVPKGIYIDIIRAMDFGTRPVEIRLLDWQKAQNMVLDHSADVTIGMSISKERRQQYDFTDTVMANEYAIFVRRGNIAIREYSDLKSREVGVTEGGFPRKVLEADPAIHLKFIPTYLAGFELLRQGKIDALVADKWVASYNIHQYNIEGVIPAQGDSLMERQGAFSVRKGEQELIQLLNNKLRALKASGKFDAILESWSPHEMIYLTRAKARNLMLIFLSSALAVILLLLTFWIYSLKRNLRRTQAAEKKIRESQEFFQKLTYHVPGLIYQFKMDAKKNLSFTYVSDAIKKMDEMDAEEVLNNHEKLFNRVHEDDKPRLALARQSSAENLKLFQVEYRSILPKGGMRWRRNESSPEKLPDGSILWHGYVSDITESKMIENALRESEERARAVAEYAPIGIVIADKDGHNKMTNRWLCERLGVTAADMQGDQWLNHVHPQDKEHFLTAWTAFWVDALPFTTETRLISSSQQVIQFSVMARKLHVNHDLLGAVIILRDLTDQRIYEAQIADLSSKIIDLREKEHMEISRELHDSVGQNLVVLKLRLQRMTDNLADITAGSLNEAIDVVSQSLLMTREISRRLNPLHLKSIGLAAAVEDICYQVRQVKKFRISLDLDGIDDHIPEELYIQVYRIVQEALTNILKHSNGDEIRVAYKISPELIILTISDNGTAPMQNAQQTPGIGLQIMRERARILGGRLNILHLSDGFQVQVEIDRRNGNKRPATAAAGLA